MSETNKDLAIVIGGGNGIGEAASRLMLNRGWNIVVADVDGAAVKRVSGELGCSGFELDITEEAAIIDVADKINSEIGQVTTRVVAAAVFQDIVPTETLQTVEWERMLRVNLTGTFLANRVFGSNMIEHGRGGSIVNIASIAAIGSMPAEASQKTSPESGVVLVFALMPSHQAQHWYRVLKNDWHQDDTLSTQVTLRPSGEWSVLMKLQRPLNSWLPTARRRSRELI